MVKRSKSEIESQLATLIPDNTSREVSPADVRMIVQDQLDSGANTNGVAEGQIGRMSSEDGVLVASALSQSTEGVESSMAIRAPTQGGLRIGPFRAGAAGQTLSATDLSRNINFGAAFHRFEQDAKLQFLSVGADVTNQNYGANQSETFAGTSFQYIVPNPMGGITTAFRIRRAAGSTQINNVNIQIRLNSHADSFPIVDYQRDSQGGAGLTFLGGASITETSIDLAEFMPYFEANTILYVTITGDGTTPLNLLGQTLPVTGHSNQTLPWIEIDGQAASPVTVLDREDGAVIADLLEALTGDNRLDAAAVRNLPPSGISGVILEDEGNALADATTTLNFVGGGVTVSGTGSEKTITIPGGSPTPQPGPNDLRYGLSSESDPASVDFSSLTDVASPTDPQTVSTGTTTAGQYFHIFSANTHDIQTITDTVLQQIVYQDGGTGNIFTKTNDARTESGVTYDAYTIGPLNAGVDEDYVLRFS